MLAVIETGSKQYTVSEGSILDVEKLDVEPGKIVTFKQVLLINQDGATTVGQPYVAGAEVEGEVLNQYRDDKILVFKFKPKTGYKKSIGHRQTYTTVKIKKISAKSSKGSAKKE